MGPDPRCMLGSLHSPIRPGVGGYPSLAPAPGVTESGQWAVSDVTRIPEEQARGLCAAPPGVGPPGPTLQRPAVTDAKFTENGGGARGTSSPGSWMLRPCPETLFSCRGGYRPDLIEGSM